MIEIRYTDTYNWMAEQAAVLPAKRVMFHCKNKQCGHKWARDYVVREQPKPCKDMLYRISPEAIMLLQDDKDCPMCGGDWVKSDEIVGVLVESKPCDDRCMNAASHKCSCSCGGRNHGSGILI